MPSAGSEFGTATAVDMDKPKVAVITTSGCPHCKRAKNLLKEAGIYFQEYNLGQAPDVLANVKKLTGKKTVPQIFLCGELLGGADELQVLLSDNSLQTRVESNIASDALPAQISDLFESLDVSDKQLPSILLPYLPSDMSEEEFACLDGISLRLSSDRSFHGRHARGLFGRSKGDAPISGRSVVDWLVENEPTAGGDRGKAEALCKRLAVARLLEPERGGSESAGPESGSFRVPYAAMRPRLGKPLNRHLEWPAPARPAQEVAEALRELITALYDKFLSDNGTKVDYDGMARDALFRHYVNSAAELQKVSLAGLSREQRMAFFINIYNAIIVHGTAVYGAPTSTLDRLRWFGSLKYDIGGAEFSADDIEHGVLRGNRPSPASLFALIGRPQWAEGHFKRSDPRARLAIDPMDPRIHFALVCGAKSCPPIRVYTPETLEEGLDAAAAAFCEGSVSVDKANRRVELSMILKWYGQDFARSLRERLAKVAEFLPDHKAQDLKELLSGGAEPTVEYTPYDWGVNKK
uniref:Duf547-domain-containing protein n=1 Tax=Tetraselmis sp. GSL018 TaxID=582737 RepID=A0A061R7D0_9CHLO